MENYNPLEKQIAEKTLEIIEGQIKVLKDNIYKWGTEMNYLDKEDLTSHEIYLKKTQEAQDELKSLEATYKTKVLLKNKTEDLKNPITVGDIKSEKNPMPMEERMEWITKGIDKKIHDMPTEKLLSDISDVVKEEERIERNKPENLKKIYPDIANEN